ncbi:MAG: cobalt ECF transporter T component CbiQ [Armatimonadetes bacterium]|nr:cobalt ECF transporter T component CbiQ [Armatimonadota bacterium]
MSILENYQDTGGFLHRRDARVKLAVCFALVVCASTGSWYDPPRLGACALLVAALLALGRLSPLVVLRRSLVVLPFLLVPALSAPFLQAEGQGSAWQLVAAVAARSWLAAMTVAVLMAATPYADLLDGASRLGMPRILITLASFLYRYLFVLVEEADRTRLARDLRGGGRGTLRSAAPVAGAMVAALFLRTYERAERIHQCMLARGFEGEARRPAPQALAPGDWAFLAAAAALIAAAFVV